MQTDGMKRRRIRAGAALLLGGLLCAAAAPAPVRIEVRNEAGAPLQCQVLASHWYAQPARDVPPGGTFRVSLLFDATTGAVLDDAQRRLPLETLFCGRAGEAWRTRSDLHLGELVAAAAGKGVARVVCRAAADRLDCRTPAASR